MSKIKKGLRILKDNGLANGSRIVLNKIIKKDKMSHTSISNTLTYERDLFKFYEYIYFQATKAKLTSVSLNKTNVIWFIPDFGIGSGGHLNIFRMIFNLSKLGIKSDIAICGDSQWVNSAIAKETLNKHFFKLDSQIIILKEQADIDLLPAYDVAMATSWQTAYYVNYFSNCYKKTYFVQDYEPFFYSLGSSYIFAENTYKFNFYGITAGKWLSSKLKKEYDMKCDSFSFSYDRELYFKKNRRENRRRVFFYARPPTDRRAFELGMLVLNKLFEKNPDIEVVLAGWDTSEYYIPFNNFNPGVVAIKELSALYSQCDVALVLSFTNLSLLPLELLASGCPVVSNAGENNSWIDENKKLFIYAESTVEDILNKLDKVLNKELNLDFEYIEKILEETSWENEAKKVKNILENLVSNK